MFDLYLTGPFVPFTLALALLFGLLALELVLALLGATLLGLGAAADIDVDIDAPDIGDFDIDFGEADPDLFEFGEPEVDADLDVDAADSLAAGPAAWLGLGKVPTLLWIASLLLGFGVFGLVLQTLLTSALGFGVPAVIAMVPAAFAGVWFARKFGALFARLLPKTETAALSARHLGRRTGVVTQGTARRGKPTEVKVTDRYGNTHYIRGEPLKDDDAIPAGTEVRVLRHRYETGYRLVPLAAAT